MNISNQNAEPHHFPPLHKIKQHVKFLSKNLPVTLCQAQEMVAYFQHCNNWSELKDSVEHGMRLQKGYRDPEIGVCHMEASNLRRKLSDLLRSDWDSGIESLSKLPLIKQTISHSIYNNRLDWLSDEEVSHLYYHLYEDNEDSPRHNLPHVLSGYDNNFLNLFHNCKTLAFGRHFYDHQYGLKLFCYKEHEDGKLTYIIREFDSYLRPPNKIYTKSDFVNRPWFVNYVVGYINNLIEILTSHGQCGELILYKVQNEYFIVNGVIGKPLWIKEIYQKLLNQDAAKYKFPGDRDPRMGLSLSFGK
jgi:hypothetical protein